MLVQKKIVWFRKQIRRCRNAQENYTSKITVTYKKYIFTLFRVYYHHDDGYVRMRFNVSTNLRQYVYMWEKLSQK